MWNQQESINRLEKDLHPEHKYILTFSFPALIASISMITPLTPALLIYKSNQKITQHYTKKQCLRNC